MASRTGIVVGVAAIAGGIAWFALRGHGDPAPGAGTSGDGDGSASLTAPTGGGEAANGARTARDGKIALDPGQRPVAQPAAEPPAMGAEPFEAQRRDEDWAKKTEADIKHRFATGVRAGKLDAAECRRDQCQLTISGSQEDLSKTFADLESEKGLLGFADHIILSGPEARGDQLVVKAYAVFDRKKSDDDNN